jgi:hypothetical protein
LIVSLFLGPKIDPGPHPGWLATIFASRGVVGAVRIAIIFAAAYVTISVCVLIGSRKWLTRVGPVEVAESARGFDAESGSLSDDLAAARDTIDGLETRLGAASQARDDALEELRSALEDVARMTHREDEKEK